MSHMGVTDDGNIQQSRYQLDEALRERRPPWPRQIIAPMLILSLNQPGL